MAVVAAVMAISAIVTSVSGALKSLGLQIRGKTQHFGWADIQPKALEFADRAYPVLLAAYTSNGLNKMTPHVIDNLVAASTTWWQGNPFTKTLHDTIVKEYQQMYPTTGPTRPGEQPMIHGLLFWTFIFVWSNVDVATPENWNDGWTAIWNQVWVAAITQSGLDPNKVETPTSGVGGSTATTTTQQVKTAGFDIESFLGQHGTTVVFVVVALAFLLALPKLKAKAA